MRRVLIFRHELLPVSETFVAAQAGALRQWTPRFAGLRRAARTLPLPADAIVLTDGSRPAELIYKWTGWAPAFRAAVKNARPDLIHAHFALDGVSALPLAHLTGAPLVVTLHGYDVTTADSVFRTRPGGRRYLKLRPRLWAQASLFLCVSEFIRQKALQLGFPEHKLRLHHIGIDRGKFTRSAPPEASGTVLFIGRLAEKKGCEYLIRAMSRVQSMHASAELVVIGDGPLRRQLEILARELRLSCKFLGSQPAEFVKQQLACARVLCAPSVTAANGDSEGLPMVVLEAQAMGIPVVASRHAGIPEAVQHEETGLLCAERDWHALSQNLLRCLQDAAFFRSCTAKARESVARKFDLLTQTQLLEDHYAEACRV